MWHRSIILLLLLLLSLNFIIGTLQQASNRSFVIDYDNNSFLKDGEPFRYISGSLHYFRIPPCYWKDRIQKAKALGLNTIQTYIPWNVHEPKPEEYSFDKQNDLMQFIELVHSEGLLLILRPGPYIDAELDFGGFPWWLAKDQTLKMRTSELKYISHVIRWFNFLLPRIKPKLYKYGGPVIALQVENEYGSYLECNQEYLLILRDIFIGNFGEDVILFTTDGYRDEELECGTTSKIFKTIDFGTEITPSQAFSQQRKHQPKGPLVNSEFYTGWLDYWGTPHQRRDADTVAAHLNDILVMNASVNLYMLQGGTNFGFLNGVEFDVNETRQIVPTSYDYDAPISEAGDTTWKYFKMREVIQKFVEQPLPPVPPNATKKAFGEAYITPTHSFNRFKGYLVYWGLKPTKITSPVGMADLDNGYGSVIYTPTIPPKYINKTVTLVFDEIYDQATFVVDGKIHSFVDGPVSDFELTVELNNTFDIMMVNQGRLAYAPKGMHYLPERKGLWGDVRIKETNKTFTTEWTAMNVNDTTLWEANYHTYHEERDVAGNNNDQQNNKTEYQVIYQSFFALQVKADTFLRLPTFNKAQVYINGYNLGRIWQMKGPQKTLFVPSCYLNVGLNGVLVMALDNHVQKNANGPDPVYTTILFEDTPDIG